MNTPQLLKTAAQAMPPGALCDLLVQAACEITLLLQRTPWPAWVPVNERMPDHRPVLASMYNSSSKRTTVIRANWIAKNTEECGADDFDGELDYSEEGDQYYWPEGWYEWNECEETHWRVTEIITHWMPLPPSAPEAAL